MDETGHNRLSGPWGVVGLAGAGVLAAAIFAVWFFTAPPGVGRAPPPPGPAAAFWLGGLGGLQGVHLTEYGPQRMEWELWAPSGNVRLQRYVFGSLRTRPLLHLLRPRATLHLKGTPLEIEAQRVYFDPRRAEWVFVQGVIRREKKRRRFRRLHWFPEQKRLEWPKTSPLHPLFRFWEPIY